jgi:hypothetical protein
MSERLDLPADPRPPDARWRQRKDHLVEELRRAARRRRRRRLAAIVLVPVAALGLVAAALVVSRTPRITAHLGCYAGPSVEADTTVVDADGRPPTAICAELWARGEVDPATRTAPSLEACVLRTGPVGVFPADPPGVCERLGLGDWTIRVEPGSFAGNRPCAAFGLMERERQVFLSGGLSRLPDALLAGLDSTYGHCLARVRRVDGRPRPGLLDRRPALHHRRDRPGDAGGRAPRRGGPQPLLPALFCLSTGPSKESVLRIHERAGHPTTEIYEVLVEVA